MIRFMTNILTNIIILIIRLYQKISSLFFPPVCRYYPSCSNYMIQAIHEHNIMSGIWLGLKRISRCHPFSDGGIDLIREEKI
jgi:uncharacterized protein